MRTVKNSWKKDKRGIEIAMNLVISIIVAMVVLGVVLAIILSRPPIEYPPNVELGPTEIKTNSVKTVTVYVNDSQVKGKGLSGATVTLSGLSVSPTTLPEISSGIYRGDVRAILGPNDDDGKVIVKVIYKDFEVKRNLVVVK